MDFEHYTISPSQAADKVLEKLGLENNKNNYEKIYRDILKRVNQGQIPSIKKGYHKNLIRPCDVNKYIEEIRIKKGISRRGEVLNNFEKQEFISDVKYLVNLFDKNILDTDSFCKCIKEIAKRIS
jgi:hypothetical protein